MSVDPFEKFIGEDWNVLVNAMLDQYPFGRMEFDGSGRLVFYTGEKVGGWNGVAFCSQDIRVPTGLSVNGDDRLERL